MCCYNTLKQLRVLQIYVDVDETIPAYVLNGLGTHIKSFTVSFAMSSAGDETRPAAILADLLVAHPHMEHLQVDYVSYNRTTQHLVYSLEETHLRNILSVVPVTKLAVQSTKEVSASVMELLNSIGSAVTELTLFDFPQHQLNALLGSFPNLTSITIRHSDRGLDSEVITALANCCMQLQYFKLGGAISSTAFRQLLGSCHRLKEVSLDKMPCITAVILQAVLDSSVAMLNRRWKLLAEDERFALAAFRELVRENQRLPAPRMLQF